MNNIDIRRLDFGILLVFLELCRSHSATLTARRLGYTQSTVSHALSRLRDVFGDDLFVRRSTGLEPTARALALEPQVRAILELTDQAMRAAPTFDPATSTDMIRIGASDYTSAVLGPPLAKLMRKAAPGMTLSIRPLTRQAAQDALASGDLDLALGYFWKTAPTMQIATLYQETYAVVARKRHPAVDQREITREAFAAADHVLVSYEGDAHGIVDRSLQPLRLTRRVAATVPFFFAAMAMVRSSDLIATIPRRLAELHAASFGLAALPPPIPIRPFRVGLAWHRRSESSRVRQWVAEQLVSISARKV